MDEPVWSSRTLIEAFHAEQVREHGGSLGIRDEGLIESALARPRQRWGYDPEADLFDLAAAYGYGLIKNHGFIDGNKRIGLVAMLVFLLVNGYEVEAAEPEVVLTVTSIADSSMSEAELAGWLRGRSHPTSAPSE